MGKIGKVNFYEKGEKWADVEIPIEYCSKLLKDMSEPKLNNLSKTKKGRGIFNNRERIALNTIEDEDCIKIATIVKEYKVKEKEWPTQGEVRIKFNENEHKKVTHTYIYRKIKSMPKILTVSGIKKPKYIQFSKEFGKPLK